MSIRVLLADDEALIRAGFKLVLRPEPDIELVGEAIDGAAAVQAALQLRPDVVVMDVRMPGMDGLETTRRLSGAYPAATYVLVSTDDVAEQPCNACGAAAFLPKKAFGQRALRRLWEEHGRTR
jgi:DNA-binding NarL/FixJ family response regulator